MRFYHQLRAVLIGSFPLATGRDMCTARMPTTTSQRTLFVSSSGGLDALLAHGGCSKLRRSMYSFADGDAVETGGGAVGSATGVRRR